MRPLTLAGMAPQIAAPQASPQLMWVDIAAIRFDDRFQRPLEKANLLAIQRIAAQFQWSRFSPVLLAPVEGGLYSCLDGQHRTHAAALCAFTAVPAMVVQVPPSEMAAAFIHINTCTIRVTGHNIYRAALMSGADWALDCRARVEAAGCRLATSNGSTASKKSGTVYAIQLIRKLILAGRGEAVTAGLTALRRFDTRGRVPLWSEYVMTPWLQAIAQADGPDTDLLVQVLERRDPFLVIEAANRLAKDAREPAAQHRRALFLAMIRAKRSPA